MPVFNIICVDDPLWNFRSRQIREEDAKMIIMKKNIESGSGVQHIFIFPEKELDELKESIGKIRDEHGPILKLFFHLKLLQRLGKSKEDICKEMNITNITVLSEGGADGTMIREGTFKKMYMGDRWEICDEKDIQNIGVASEDVELLDILQDVDTGGYKDIDRKLISNYILLLPIYLGENAEDNLQSKIASLKETRRILGRYHKEAGDALRSKPQYLSIYHDFIGFWQKALENRNIEMFLECFCSYHAKYYTDNAHRNDTRD